MARRQTRSHRPLYPPIMLRPIPFALPAHFLRQLGYNRAVAVPRLMPSNAARSVRRWPPGTLGLVATVDDRRPRRFVALWWESTRGQLGWTDGLRTGVGELDHQPWLAWLHAGRPLGLIAAWLIEHEVCLDGAVSPERGPAHWLLVDGNRDRAWVVIQGLGRTIVRRQRFHTPSDA